ncbi:MAG: MFS transporter [Thaumarchaeota archaeon]|nr:MFS transporter [Nitrososphaerota archaeon]
MSEEKKRLLTGAGIGHLHSIILAFAFFLPLFYLNSLGLTLVVYATLFVVGDVFAFAVKPFVGYLTDKYGEGLLLTTTSAVFFISLFLIGQTASLGALATLRIANSVSGSVMFILVIIYGLRLVKSNPDYKVGLFNAIKNGGWIVGLSIFLYFFNIKGLGLSAAFYLILILGIVWTAFTYSYTRKVNFRPKISLKPSLSYLKRIPLFMSIKTLDLAMFTAFVIFFIPLARDELGLPRTIITIVVIVELIAFVGSNYLVGRFSNKSRRKYLIPIGILGHLLAGLTMLLATDLIHYFMVGIFIGIAGGFVDVWLFSRISESVKTEEKGKFLGTVGWSWDLGTIVGGLFPVGMILIGLNQFVALLLIPGLMAVSYLTARIRNSEL